MEYKVGKESSGKNLYPEWVCTQPTGSKLVQTTS